MSSETTKTGPGIGSGNSSELKPANAQLEPPSPPILTFGQKAVGINFNHAQGETFSAVDRAKQTMANAIDQMNAFRNQEGATAEQKRLASIAITELQGTQMWMVKALTWKD